MGWLLIGNKSSKRLEIALTNRCRQLVAASTQLVPLGLHLIESCLHRRQRSRPLTVDELSDVFFETPTTSRVTAFASLVKDTQSKSSGFSKAEAHELQLLAGQSGEVGFVYSCSVAGLCPLSLVAVLTTAQP